MQEGSCSCGLVVIESGELDELGLCVICAGSGHEWACVCIECSLYREAIDEGMSPSVALERAHAEVG